MAGDNETDRFGIGANHPPFAMTAVEVARFLADMERPLLARRDELLAGVARFSAKHPTITDDETQSAAGDFVRQIAAAVKQARDRFATAKKPYVEGGRAVDRFFAGITDPLEQGLNEVRRPMTAYALEVERAERARREAAAAAAREEATRLRRELWEEEQRQAKAARDKLPASAPMIPPLTIEEAIGAAAHAAEAEKAANAKSADLTRNRGDLGSVSSLRDVWDVEVEQLSLVPLEFLVFDQAKARKAVAGGKLRAIPGCRVFVSQHVQVR